jgi:hypothetical protein
MGIIERLGNLLEKRKGDREAQRTTACQEVTEGSASHVAHCDVLDTVGRANVVDRDDVRVLDPSRCSCLAHESSHDLLITGQLRPEHLQCDETV